MKKKRTLLFLLVLIAFSSYGQKLIYSKQVHEISKPAALPKPEYVHGDSAYYVQTIYSWNSYKTEVKIYKDGKKVFNEKLKVEVDGIEYPSKHFIYTNDTIISYFIAENGDKDGFLYIQRYDLNFVPLGEPIKVIDFPKAINYSLLDIGKMFSMEFVNRSFEATYSEHSRNILFNYSIHIRGKNDKYYSTSKSVLVDQNFQVLNVFYTEANNPENKLEFQKPTVLNNGDAAFILKERSVENEGEISKLYGMNVVYVSAKQTEPKTLEISPNQPYVINANICETVDKNGSLIYSIASKETQDNDVTYFNIYKFNREKSTLTNYSYVFDVKKVFESEVLGNLFVINKVRPLEDGSMLLLIRSPEGYNDYGFAAVNINSNDEVVWQSGFNKFNYYGIYTGFLDFINNDGNLELIFNSNKNNFEDGKLKTPKGMLGGVATKAKYTIYNSDKSIIIKAIFNILNGDIKIEKLYIKNARINGIDIKKSKELERDGVFLSRAFVNKQYRIIHIDFNEE